MTSINSAAVKIFAFVLCLLSVAAGNAGISGSAWPSLANVRIRVDRDKRQVAIRYDLTTVAPSEGARIRVRVLDSNNSILDAGRYDLSGDTGYVIGSGKGKKIVIRFRDKDCDIDHCFVQLVVYGPHPVPAIAVADNVQPERLSADVRLIYGERNVYSKKAKAHLRDARELIERKFRECHLNIVRQSFRINDSISGENIIGEIPAATPTDSTVVIGAHFDTVEGSAGADDNATGIAALLELAEILSKYTYRMNIKLVAFDFEEAINFIPDHQGIEGSRAFVKSEMAAHDSVVAAVNIDMIGYSSDKPNSQIFPAELKGVFPALYTRISREHFKGNFILIISNQASGFISERLLALGKKEDPGFRIHEVRVPGNGENLDDFRRSDHVNFWDNGFPAVSLGDGAYSRNPHYHSPADKLSDINWTFLDKSVRLVCAYAADQAGITNSRSVFLALR